MNKKIYRHKKGIVAMAFALALIPQGVSAVDLPSEADALFNILAEQFQQGLGQSKTSEKQLYEMGLSSDDPELQLQAMEVFYQLGRWDAVRDIGTRFLQQQPTNTRAASLLAIAYYELDAPSIGVDTVLKIVKLEGTDNDAFTALSQLLEADPSAEAMQMVEELDSSFPNDIAVLKLRARLSLAAGLYKEAINVLDKAIEISPDVVQLRLAKYFAAQRSADEKTAAVAITAALEQLPTDPWVVSSYYSWSIKSGQSPKLIEAAYNRVEQVLQGDPAQLFAELERAIDNDITHFASAALSKLEQLGVELPQLTLLQAKLAEAMDDTQSAVALYQSFDRGDLVYYQQAQVYLAYLYAQREEEGSAMDVLDTLIDAGDSYAAVRPAVRAKIGFYTEDQRYDQAVAQIDKWIGKFGESSESELYFERGMVNVLAGDLEAFEYDMQQAIAYDPQNAHAMNALGYEFANRGVRMDEAGALIKSALALQPNDAPTIDSLGWWHFRRGEMVQAQRNLRRAFGLMRDAEVGAHLGELLWGQNRRDEAVRLWEELERDFPEQKVLKETMERLNP